MCDFLTADGTADLAEVLHGLESDVQRAIQFVRSAPGLTSALVGMRLPVFHSRFPVAGLPFPRRAVAADPD
jgi:hypothetical protein